MRKFLLLILTSFLLPIFVLAIDKVEINTATLAQLDTLTGIGPVTAQKIIDARPFSSIDDLLKVSGIGPKTLQKIKDQGLACVNCQVLQPIQELITTTSPTIAIIAPAPVLVYPTGIFIKEILPNPAGADETDEWIKLYNSNKFDVDLSGWKVQDTAGTPRTYTFADSVKISTNGFLILKRPETKIMLNNDEDGINLLTPDGKIVDSVSFTSAPLGQIYSKTASGWVWSGNKALPKTKNSVKNNVVTADLTGSQIINTNQDGERPGGCPPWFLFFMVLGTTIILAGIILFIKLKLKNHVRT